MISLIFFLSAAVKGVGSTTNVKDKTEVSKIFPWVHTAISNAKKKYQAYITKLKMSICKTISTNPVINLIEDTLD